MIITAQGLLPYFERDEVHRLLATWARLLPGAWLLFDAVTAQMQALRDRNPLPDAYRPPDWTWTLGALYQITRVQRTRRFPALHLRLAPPSL